MLLSPELAIAEMPSRAVVLRVEDILLMVIFLVWLAKTALNKELGLIRSTPLNLPIASFIFLVIFSTVLGIAGGWIHPLRSFFYILKYFEYFILFFLISNVIYSKKQVEVFMLAFFITAFLICLYAFRQIGTGVRVCAPFEGESEPNTLGGYLLLIMGILGGLTVCLKSWKVRLFLLGLLVFAFIPFLHTLSRGAWLGLIPMFIVLVLLSPGGKKLPLLIIFIISLIMGSMFMPNFARQRIESTFIAGKVYDVGQQKVALEMSAAARIDSWEHVVFKDFPKRPIFGWGITGIGFVDNNYVLWLGEMGFLGILVFLWIITTIARNSLEIYRRCQDDFLKGLTLGLLLALTGVSIQALTANSFIIVRIMEPFWFLTAIVFSIPRIIEVELDFNEAT